jgi:hypothetical protein
LWPSFTGNTEKETISHHNQKLETSITPFPAFKGAFCVLINIIPLSPAYRCIPLRLLMCLTHCGVACDWSIISGPWRISTSWRRRICHCCHSRSWEITFLFQLV